MIVFIIVLILFYIIAVFADGYKHGMFGNYYIQQTEFYGESITMIWHRGQVIKEFAEPAQKNSRTYQKAAAKGFISCL